MKQVRVVLACAAIVGMLVFVRLLAEPVSGASAHEAPALAATLDLVSPGSIADQAGVPALIQSLHAPTATQHVAVEATPTPQPTPVPVPAATLTRQPSPRPVHPTIPPSPVTTRTAISPTAPAPTRVSDMPDAINGVSLDEVVVMSGAVQQHIREVYARGQAQGRNAHAFSKIGDSTMVWPPLLAAFASPSAYRLGGFAQAQRTIDRYAGSFARASAAARKGMHSWSEFDPQWANSDQCQPGEGPLACELRPNNPSVAIIRLGANDTSTPALFAQQLRRIVETCLNSGVIPVLGTKPDRLEGPDNTLNKLIAGVAAEYNVPLWDYDLAVSSVPGKGLEQDGVHFRGIGSHDYTSPQAFQSGDSIEDLTALMALDAVQQVLTAPMAAQQVPSGS